MLFSHLPPSHRVTYYWVVSESSENIMKGQVSSMPPSSKDVSSPSIPRPEISKPQYSKRKEK
jgi:hypothetical protein